MKFAFLPVLILGVSLSVSDAQANNLARDSALSKLMFSNELKTFDVSPGSLHLVLQQFEQESGIGISYPQSLIERRFSRGVQGSYSTEQALKRLLSATGITYKVSAAGSVKLEPVTENVVDNITHIQG